MRNAASILLVVMVAGALAQPPARAQGQGYASSAATSARPLGESQRLERRFLQVTADSMRFQVEATRMVASRSNNAAVRDLAHTLAAHQKAMQPELLHLLQARGMAMPIQDPHHAKVLKHLSKLNGAAFDRAYVEQVLLYSTKSDIANFERIGGEAEDPVLKAWAGRELPTLRIHHDQAARALPPGTAPRGQRVV
jgi:putative membrane protein